MNSKHRKTLSAIRAEPVQGSLEWSRIEALLIAIGCRVVEARGSAVTFERDGCKLTVHRPHPGREALRYRVRAVREYLQRLGVEP
ncbi:MAG: type II toxin-antitoxin system HicA family toxin [Burkholderiales bacterium]|jgi:hypothetical protein|nr:type II toxin-antitoxin system HicA family toxin [Burkholderiales bacterium]